MDPKIKHGRVTDEEIKEAVLWKFWNKRAFGNRHIYESDIPKGLPPHLHKRVMDCVKELRREGMITEFPHGKEHAFVINPDRFDHVREILRKKLEI